MSTFKSYLTGFIISLALTLTAYYFTYRHLASGHQMYSHNFLYPFLGILVFVQAVIQLIFFLHLQAVSRFSKIIFISTLSIMFILIAGSVWIMGHLNYNMTPDQMNSAMLKMEGMDK